MAKEGHHPIPSIPSIPFWHVRGMENPGFSRWDSLVAPGTDSRATLLREPRFWSLPACPWSVRPGLPCLSRTSFPGPSVRGIQGLPGASCFASHFVPGEPGLPGPCLSLVRPSGASLVPGEPVAPTCYPSRRWRGFPTCYVRPGFPGPWSLSGPSVRASWRATPIW